MGAMDRTELCQRTVLHSTRLRRACSALVAAALMGASSPAAAAGTDRDVLAIGVTGDDRASLWPVELRLSLAAADGPARPLAPRTMLVRDGNRMVFDEAVWTDRGLERFSLVVTPRHHPGGVVELEWELTVWFRPYALGPDGDSWRRYLAFRAGLGPRPPLERPVLVAVRADIVRTRGEAREATIRAAGRAYRLVLAARTTHPGDRPG